MKQFIIVIAAVFAGLVSLAASAQQQSSPSASVYGRSNALISGSALQGTVVQVRRVRIEANSTATNISRGAGAAIGGALGSRLGKSTATNIAGGVLGGLFGGVIGDVAADAVASHSGVEIIVALGDGRVVVVTQEGDSLFGPGQPVYLIQSGGTMRIVERAVSINTDPTENAQPQSFIGARHNRRSF